MKLPKTRTLLILLIFSILLFLVSLVLAFSIIPDIFDSDEDKFDDEDLGLENGTDQYDRFLEPSDKSLFKVYLFHVENPEEILNNGAIPDLTQIGPFVYTQLRNKTVVSEDNDTITYIQHISFTFDEEASRPLKKDSEVVTLNVALMMMLEDADNDGLGKAASQCFSRLFHKHEGIFMRITADDLLFQGLDFCKPDDDPSCGIINTKYCELFQPRRNVEAVEDFLRFSYFNYKQKSNDGEYVVKRGLENSEELGEIIRWNNLEYTDFWGENTSCSMVKGRDGTMFPPKLSKQDRFSIYSTDICRYLEIVYEDDSTWEGIRGLNFMSESAAFYSSEEVAEDDCFCTKLTTDVNGGKSCFLDGIIDLQSCTEMPFLLSFPHFLGADDHYVDAVLGLDPNNTLHNSNFVIEPETGLPLTTAKRMQLNAILRRMDKVTVVENVTSLVLPLLWIEEETIISDDYVERLNPADSNQKAIFLGLRWGLVALAALLVLIFGGCLIKKKLF